MKIHLDFSGAIAAFKLVKCLTIILALGWFATSPVDAKASTPQTPSAMSNDFHGNVTYTGTYEMWKTTAPRIPSRLSLNSMLGAVQNAKSNNYHGSIRVKLEINGRTVRGSYSSSNPLGSGVLNGTRDGDVCHLKDRNSTWEVNCRPNRFDGEVTTFEGVSPKITASFHANATEFVDLGARQKTQMAKAKAQDDEVEALPMAGPALSNKLEKIVEKDSKGWVMNQYDAGTIHNVRIAEGSASSGKMTLRGEYTFNGGTGGWVMARLSGGNLVCVEFWDQAGRCRSLKSPEQAQQMRGMLLEGFTGGSSGQGTSSGRTAEQQREQDFNDANMRQQDMQRSTGY